MSMRHRHQAPAEGPLAEINTTPLIDVSLVLVVILMMATPLAFESSFGVRGGTPLARPAVAGEPADRVELAITGENRVEVDGRPLAVDQLAGALLPLFAGRPGRDVAVSCADEVSHRAFVTVLDIAKSSGAGHIAVAEK